MNIYLGHFIDDLVDVILNTNSRKHISFNRYDRYSLKEADTGKSDQVIHSENCLICFQKIILHINVPVGFKNYYISVGSPNIELIEPNKCVCLVNNRLALRSAKCLLSKTQDEMGTFYLTLDTLSK